MDLLLRSKPVAKRLGFMGHLIELANRLGTKTNNDQLLDYLEG